MTTETTTPTDHARVAAEALEAMETTVPVQRRGGMLADLQARLKPDMDRLPALRAALADAARFLPTFAALQALVGRAELARALGSVGAAAHGLSSLALEGGPLDRVVRVLSSGAAHLVNAEAAYAQLGPTLMRRPGHLDWAPEELTRLVATVRDKINSVSLPALAEDMGIVRGLVKRALLTDAALRALGSLDGDKPARYEALFRAVAEGRDDADVAAVPLSPPTEPVTVTSGPAGGGPPRKPERAPRRSALGPYARRGNE